MLPKEKEELNREKAISKTLSKLLRHEAQNQHLTVSPDGYVPISEILSHHWVKRHRATKEDIQLIVNQNDKRRFKIKDDCICALQGHSMKLESLVDDLVLLDHSNLPKMIVHGTFRKALPGIKKMGGLSPMTRNHIHFATGVPPKFKQYLPNSLATEQVISGMRNSCQVIIALNVNKLAESKIDVFKSGNGVILIDSKGLHNGVIGVDFFDKIIDIDKGVITL